MQTLQKFLVAVQREEQQLELEYASHSAHASYSGQRPERSDFETAFGRTTSYAQESADQVYKEARKALKHAIIGHRQSRNTVQAWLWRHGVWRFHFRFTNLTPPLRDAWCARRTAFEHRLATRKASFAMSVRIGAGDLAQTIAKQLANADEEHQRASAQARVALNRQADIKATREGLAVVSEWLDSEQERFEAHHALTECVEVTVGDWITDTKSGAPTSPPVLRVRTDASDIQDFRNVARSVTAAWLEQAQGLALSVNARPEIMRNALAKIGMRVEPGLDGLTALCNLWEALKDPQLFDPDVKALLYWVASAAEVAMIRELTAKTDEEPLTLPPTSIQREVDSGG